MNFVNWGLEISSWPKKSASSSDTFTGLENPDVPVFFGFSSRSFFGFFSTAADFCAALRLGLVL